MSWLYPTKDHLYISHQTVCICFTRGKFEVIKRMTAVATDFAQTCIVAAGFSNAIEQLGETYEYKGEPNAALYFTDQYLPAGGFSLN